MVSTTTASLSSAAVGVAVVESLECGTSLAEREFCDTTATATTTATLVEDTKNRQAPEESKNGNHNTPQLQASVVHRRDVPGSLSHRFDSVEALRTALADDVWTQEDSYTTFASPLERPPSSSGNRFYQVPLVYADQTASNRPLQSLEEYLQRTCLPYYGNTHTNTSITGSQSTAFVAEARQLVAEATNARITGKASRDVVLFAGNGTTSAVELLIDCLGLAHAASSNDARQRPVVFVGPYEHHSNLIPWRESGCEIVMVPECPDSHAVNLQALETLLQRYPNRVKMGTFSAASNVTGKITSLDPLAALLHKYGALAFFDYASGAPYLSMDMNPAPTRDYPDAAAIAKDAIFLSPHKMLGGPGTPGVLIVKKHLVSQTNAPRRSGGGTVFYVTNNDHRFLSNRVERYEGGTPNVTGIIRVGLTFLLKRQAEAQFVRARQHEQEQQQNDAATEATAVPQTIEEYDTMTYHRVAEYLRQNAPNLVLLGETKERGQNLPIFSFLIRFGKRFLHYNFVCALLNDVFGIQSRGGCQCAGPYSQRLLGLTQLCQERDSGPTLEVPNGCNRQVEEALVKYKERAELLRPGYSRLSLPFKGMQSVEVDYILKALVWVSKHGWALMCQYRCNHRTGEWRHANRQGKPLGREQRRWLGHYRFGSTPSTDGVGSRREAQQSYESFLEQTLRNADEILASAKTDQRHIAQALKMADADSVLDEGDLETLRWYAYPKECAELLQKQATTADATNSKPLGALDPNAPVRLVVDEKRHDDVPQIDAKRRKLHHETVQDRVSKRYMFRDGEHTGEASFEEIEEGINEGELSENAVVYNNDTGEWVRAVDLITTSMDVSPTTSPTKGTSVPASQPVASDQPIKTDETLQTSKPSIGTSGGEGKLNEGKVGTAAAGSSSLEKQTVATENETTGQATNLDPRTVVSFRDSEHTGEAPLFEIEEGIKDGELSASTQIFDPNSGIWMTLHNEVSAVAEAKAETTEPKSGETMETSNSQTEDKEENSEPKVNEKVENGKSKAKASKKAVRGSSTWGQGVSSLSQSDSQAPPLKTADGAASVPTSGKAKRTKHIRPPPKLMRLVTQAVFQWDMIQEGDRMLLGLSGGKDSLSLLHCLMELQRKLPTKFELEVCTIDPMTPSFDPSPLIPYVESLGLKYHYVKDDIVNRAASAGKNGKVVSSLCAFCARMKRGNLYNVARTNKCNKLVLAQHLDDCAESFFMSVMHNGFLRTMKANYEINAGEIRVIRPMVYCRESLMTDFAKSANLPVINENCPACFEEPKERARVKKLLSREELNYPNFYDNIRRSLLPLMHSDSESIMHSITDEAVAKSKRKDYRNGKGQNGKSNEDGKQAPSGRIALSELAEEELRVELLRRKASRYALAGAMKSVEASPEANLSNASKVCDVGGKCSWFD